MKLRKGLSMMICGDCMGGAAFLSEKHRVEVQVRKPVNRPYNFACRHTTQLFGNPRAFSRY